MNSISPLRALAIHVPEARERLRQSVPRRKRHRSTGLTPATTRVRVVLD